MLVLYTFSFLNMPSIRIIMFLHEWDMFLDIIDQLLHVLYCNAGMLQILRINELNSLRGPMKVMQKKMAC